MLLLHERTFSHDEVLEVELHDDLRYRLGFGDLVVYEDHLKRIRGKVYPYQFRSVEQLRYDFERDVLAAGGRLGENP